MKYDIHNYNKRLEYALKNLDKDYKEKKISKHNYELLKKFDRDYSLSGVSVSRRQRIIGILDMITREYIKKNLDKLDADYVKDLIVKIDTEHDWTVWTRHTYKNALRTFFKWLEFKDEFMETHETPLLMRGIKIRPKKNEIPHVKRSDLYTEQEILKMIDACENERDRCFISMIWELGARVGEIGSGQIKSISQDPKSKGYYMLLSSGKSGERTPILIFSDPYIRDWLDKHPEKNNPEAPLWYRFGKSFKKGKKETRGDTEENRGESKFLNYDKLSKIIKRAAVRAKINKPIKCHTFRKSRVTYLLSNKIMNESQVKIYMGWVKDSDMLSFYSFLETEDSNNAMREHYGFSKPEDKIKPKSPRECVRCKKMNKYNAVRCKDCGMILDLNEAAKLSEDYDVLEKKQDASNRLLFMLAKQNLEKLKGKKKKEAEDNLKILFEGLKENKDKKFD